MIGDHSRERPTPGSHRRSHASCIRALHLPVKGGRLRPWTWPSYARDRAEVEQLSGQRAVPILVLDKGEVITGSGQIVSWAQANQPASAVT